jgi:metal-sulfur cluster biosynthetic enzyme
MQDPALLQEAIIRALQEVYDPEIPVNIYELGLIYHIEVNPQGQAKIVMTLTSPFARQPSICPTTSKKPWRKCPASPAWR